MREFLARIRRRRLWQVSAVYVVVAWGLLQVADTVLPTFGTPQWVMQTFTVALVLGFPIALVFAWAQSPASPASSGPNVSPVPAPELAAGDVAPARRASGRSWIAVMPFKVSGDMQGFEAFSEGLTEDISAGLARFSYLAVVVPESSRNRPSDTRDARAFGEALGARYVIEGSVRGSGDTVRVSARLAETASGVSLWAENYSRNLAGMDRFAAEDDISDRVVATVADSFGVLVGELIAEIADRPESELSPNDWVLRTFDYLRLYLPGPHQEMRAGLERAVEAHPRSAEVWACLAHLYLNEYSFGFNPRPDPLDRALKAADTAFELNNASQFVNQQLAQVYFFRRDLSRFRAAAERAISLNPRDTNTLGILGLLMVHVRDFDRGMELTQRAMDLNSNHAHWCHFSHIWFHFARGEYEQALEAVSRVNISGNFWIPLATTAIYSALDREPEAKAAAAQLLAVAPDIASHARANIEAWHFASGLMEPLLDGLKKAGIAIPAN